MVVDKLVWCLKIKLYGEGIMVWRMAMTKLLQEAFRKASELPENLQDQLAQTLIDEVKWEQQWDSTLETPESNSVLESLSEKALNEFDAAQTEEKGFGGCEVVFVIY